MTALVAGQAGAQTGTTGQTAMTHGTTSQVFKSVGTLTAEAAFGCCEHGVFNESHFRWWSVPPKGWAALDLIASDVISLFIGGGEVEPT